MYIHLMNDTTSYSPTPQEAATVGGTCAVFHLRKAMRAVQQIYDEILRSTGLKGTQYTVLMALRAAGTTSVNELADALVTDRTTLTRNLKPLVRDGLVVSIPASHDRRVRELSLTEAGQETIAEAYPLWQKAQAEMAERLGGERFEHLVAELHATVEAARD